MEFSVSPYGNKGNIIDSLKEYDSTFIDSLSSNNKHFNYLETYLGEKKVKTILFEFEYIDKDYIEDYSQYYSKCFRDYKKKCVRLHFFKNSFNRVEFEEILISTSSETVDKLQENYVGFVVLRPIPLTIFGKTCLKTYPQNNMDEPSKNRFFPIIRQYHVHLFGIDLSVDSIAFQEQDNSVSACATSALWSAFHGTGILFHHHIPSPFEITLTATKLITDYTNRSFPNKGLLFTQMAHAIKELRLDPLLVDFFNMSFFKARMYAYLKAGVPIMIGVKMIGYASDKEDCKGKFFGFHAVTATGYNLNSTNKPEVFKKTKKTKGKDLYLISSTIDIIYVHDDQIGPFAKMKMVSGSSLLSTTWADLDKEQFSKVEAEPTALLIPLHPKIRIDFDKIFDIVNAFNNIEFFYNYKDIDIIWDIYLSTISQLKKFFFDNKFLQNDNKLKLLTRSFPKYVWVANGYINEGGDKKSEFSFYFDATDVDNGNLFICSVHYDIYSYAIFRKLAAKYKEKGSQRIFSINNIANYHSQQILSDYLDDIDPPSLIENRDKKMKIYTPKHLTLEEINSISFSV